MNFESLGLSPRVLDFSELEEVLSFEKSRLAQDDIMASWHAPWRQESLEHYLPKGWCFALRDPEENLKAYFLAQPLLFYGGMTQTLWVEYMSYDSKEILHALVDLARRYARDKHLQKVILNLPPDVDLTDQGAMRTPATTFEFNTTKMG